MQMIVWFHTLSILSDVHLCASVGPFLPPLFQTFEKSTRLGRGCDGHRVRAEAFSPRAE